MDRDHIDVITSNSAEAIRAYCRVLARELGLTLSDVRWTSVLSSDLDNDPYRLVLTITEPFRAPAEFWFTRAQVLDYATGQSTGEVQRKLRQDLTARLAEIR